MEGLAWKRSAIGGEDGLKCLASRLT